MKNSKEHRSYTEVPRRYVLIGMAIAITIGIYWLFDGSYTIFGLRLNSLPEMELIFIFCLTVVSFVKNLLEELDSSIALKSSTRNRTKEQLNYQEQITQQLDKIDKGLSNQVERRISKSDRNIIILILECVLRVLITGIAYFLLTSVPTVVVSIIICKIFTIKFIYVWATVETLFIFGYALLPTYVTELGPDDKN